MAKYISQLDTRVMVGVGAAFDLHTGRLRDCPQWMKPAGLQWLHRLWQEPSRLWRRYLYCNPLFLFHIALQFAGIRRYDLPSVPIVERDDLSSIPAPPADLEQRAS